MGKLEDLRTELDAGHPDTGAYDVNDVLAADQISVVNRTRDRTEMSASEVLNAIEVSAYNSLTANDKSLLWGLLGMGTLNPFGREADVLVGLFGGGSATITALAAARKEAVSRATEIGLGGVKSGTVAQARAL